MSGMRLRFIDTPGLEPSASRIGHNQRVLSQIKKAMNKYKPDLVLYIDRMDVVRAVPARSSCFQNSWPGC